MRGHWLAGKWRNPQEVLDNVRIVEHMKDSVNAPESVSVTALSGRDLASKLFTLWLDQTVDGEARVLHPSWSASIHLFVGLV